MSSGENICNAFRVILSTYENVQKLLDYSKIVAQEKTDYRLASPKFLRKKSDNDTTAWLINDFILLFQNKNDPDCEAQNEWKSAPVYVFEIFLGNEESDDGDIPLVYLSKFEYKDINEWGKGCSPADHWAFYWPPVDDRLMDIIENQDYSIATPKNEKSSNTYWGLKKVITLEINLMEITSENIKEKIFDNFDRLRNLE